MWPFRSGPKIHPLSPEKSHPFQHRAKFFPSIWNRRASPFLTPFQGGHLFFFCKDPNSPQKMAAFGRRGHGKKINSRNLQPITSPNIQEKAESFLEEQHTLVKKTKQEKDRTSTR